MQRPTGPIVNVDPIDVVEHIGRGNHRAQGGAAQYEHGHQRVDGAQECLEGRFDEAHHSDRELLHESVHCPQHGTEYDPSFQVEFVGAERYCPVGDAACDDHVQHCQGHVGYYVGDYQGRAAVYGQA